jgi:hypothetical protein
MTRGVRICRDRVFLRRDRGRTVPAMPVTAPAPAPRRVITDADCHAAQLVALLRTWNYSY